MSSTLTVRKIRRVSIGSVKIHAPVYAALTPTVQLGIIFLSVYVTRAMLEIHSQLVIDLQVRIFIFYIIKKLGTKEKSLCQID